MKITSEKICREVGGSVDGLHLLSVLSGQHPERWIELGCGCGELALQAAEHNQGVHIDALEIQQELVDLAEAKVTQTMHGRVRIIWGDVRNPPNALMAENYDQVFCNPPFFLPEKGRLPPNRVRAIARFELQGKLEDFIQCGSMLLGESGLFHMVHRSERLPEIILKLQTNKLNPFRVIPVYSKVYQSARLVVVSACKGGKKPFELAHFRLDNS